jgi:type II secretory pathway pseudopilin PulG
MKVARGMTLIEMTIATMLMMVVLACAAELVLQAGQMARNSEQLADRNDGARLAGEFVVTALRQAGVGFPRGLWVNCGGTPLQIGAAFGNNNVTGSTSVRNGTDDLWVVVPTSRAMGEPCIDRGAVTTLTQGGVSPPTLRLRCVNGFANGDLVAVSNMGAAALVSVNGAPDTVGNTLPYAESSVGNFSNAPESGGFKVGDLAYTVNVYHFYVANLVSVGGAAFPVLYRERGAINGGCTSGSQVPFVAIPNTGQQMQPYVEDLQIAYARDIALTSQPSQYAFSNGLGPTTGVLDLRSLRISVVSRSRAPIRDTIQRTAAGQTYAPFSVVEDHLIASPVVDGFSRSLYTRRVELLNMVAANL